MKRGESGLSGILAIDKPAGMTSHDVVNRVRRAAGERRVGHAGTLDPAATGLLVVCVGPAARLTTYLTGHDKSYRATIVFGASTATDDAEGEVVQTADVPVELNDPAFAREALAGLVGEHDQVPPAFSAVKRDGKRAYEVARKGGQVELEARRVRIDDARLLGVAAIGGPLRWEVELDVSKGTYIRSIARDLGERLGTRAHLGALRRLSAGSLSLERAVALDAVEQAGPQGVEGLFCDPVAALSLPRVELAADKVEALGQGKVLAAPDACDGLPEGPVAVTCGTRLLSVHQLEGGRLRALTVIPGGVAGCPSL